MITITSDNIANKVFAEQTAVSTPAAGRDIYLHAISMCPDTAAALYIENDLVTSNTSFLCQPANRIAVSDASKTYLFQQNDGIVNLTSNAFCKVIATSNNIIYTDENFINISVTRYNDKMALPDYKVGDVLYQVSYSPTFYTLVPSYPNPNPAPLYRVGEDTDVSAWAWGNWMIGHAVWNKIPTSKYHSYVFPNVTFSKGQYQATWAIDNTGVIKVGTQIIGEMTYDDNRSWQDARTTLFTLDTAGDYAVSWEAVNVGGPGGVALVIQEYVGGVAGKIVFDTSTAYVTQLTKEYHVDQTFQATVENVYYTNSDKTKAVLALKPQYGTLNPNAAAANDVAVIRRFSQYVTSNNPVQNSARYYFDNLKDISQDLDISILDSTASTSGITYLTGDIWPVGSKIQRIPAPDATRKTILSTEQATITSYDHFSGLCLPASSGVSFYTQSKVVKRPGDVVHIYDASTGQTVTREYSGSPSINKLTLSTSLTQALTSNCRYTVGSTYIDAYGSTACILTIPETLEKILTSGVKKITMVDADSKSTTGEGYRMKATTNYQASVSISYVYDRTPSKPKQQFAEKIAPPPKSDPVAQTFFVPSAYDLEAGTKLEPYGIYVSSVDIWFAKKPYPSTTSDEAVYLPCMLRLVEVQLGLPTENIIAETYAEWRDVVVPTDNIFNKDLYTKFKFRDPVHLPYGGQYAIVVISPSPDYYILISELGKYTLKESSKSTAKSKQSTMQPNVGSFFKSQNASTWTPIQDTDMVFRLNKCVFNQSFGTLQYNVKPRGEERFADAVVVYTSETNYKPTKTSYSIKTKNILNTNDLSETTITPNTLYDFGRDLQTSPKDSTKRRWIVGGESTFNVAISLSSTDKSVTPCINKESLRLLTYTTIINDAGISNNNITITSGGSHANIANIEVVFSNPDSYVDSTSTSILNSGAPASGFVYALDKPNSYGLSTINNVVIDYEGYGYYTTPQIRITETFDKGTITSNNSTTMTDSTKTWSVVDQWKDYYVEIISTAINSVVLNQQYIINTIGKTNFTEIGAPTNCTGILFTATDSRGLDTASTVKLYTYKKITASSTSGQLTISGWDAGGPNSLVGKAYRIVGGNPAKASVAGETNAIGGNCEVRYITKLVELAHGFDAGDLKVYLDCIRPQGTNVVVYYKVISAIDTDHFDDKYWQLMYKSADLYSKDQKTIIQLQFDAKVNDRKQLTYFQNGQTYPIGGSFCKFAIKICLTAGDPSVTPVVIDFSAIAVPAG